METKFTISCLLIRYYYLRDSQTKNKIQRGEGEEDDDDDDDDDEKSCWVLGACIFLGAKVSEEPRRLRDIVNCVQMIRPECPEYTRIEQTTTNKDILLVQSKSKQLILWTRQPPILNDAYWDSKQKIIETEQHVLRWIYFDTYVPSPHRAVLIIMDQLCLSAEDEFNSGSTKKKAIVFLAWKILNNTIFSVACLQHHVMALSLAAVTMALENLDLEHAVLHADWYNLSKEQVDAARLDLTTILQTLQGNHSRATERIQSELE